MTLLAGAALLTGCSGAAEQSAAGPSTAPPFADCAALTSAPSPGPASRGSASGAPASRGSAAGMRLPDLTLPCFTGDQTVNIGQIRGPALINLWASWCPPCRAELPALQRLAARAGDRLHVIGVVSEDARDAAQSLAEDLRVTFPTLYDRPAGLFDWTGRAGLPVTVFVGADGRISHVYNAAPLDDAALARLVDTYLQVVVAA
jgi:thiol-disulfide isomerase/thioredoxin